MTGMLFDNTHDRRPRRVLMHVVDAGEGDGLVLGDFIVRMACDRCGHETDWIEVRSVAEGKRGLPCPKCNPQEPTP